MVVSSSSFSRFVPQTFQRLQQPAPVAREYILTIPETQMPSSQVIQPVQQSQVASKGHQQQSRRHPISFLICEDQQAGPSRPLTFTLTQMKHFKHLSVASARGYESQYNMSGLSSFFGNLQSVMSYQHTTAIITSQHASTSHLSSNHYHLTARI